MGWGGKEEGRGERQEKGIEGEKEDRREGRGERGKEKGGRMGREEGRKTKDEEQEERVNCIYIHVNSREVTYLQIILILSNLKHTIMVTLKLEKLT